MKSHHRSPSRLIMFMTCLGIANALCASNAHALELCVNTAAALNSAFALGQFQTQGYTIKMVQGTYAMNTDNFLVFSAPTKIEGGYTANCASRVIDPANTVLQLQGHVFAANQFAASPEAFMGLEGLTIAGGTELRVGAGAHGTFSDDEGSISIRNVRVTNMAAGLPSPIQLSAYNNHIDLENVLVDHVSSTGDTGIQIFAEDGATLAINHLTADLAPGNNIVLDDNGRETQMSVYNSILWSSSGGVPLFLGDLDSDTSVVLVNDIFDHEFTLGSVTIQNQLNTNPLWINPATGNYRLQNASPAVNSGTLFTPGGEPTTDIEGKARIIGSTSDRGAYESLVSDLTTILVTNTLDSGPGSLRDAVTIANASLSPPKKITFDIRNQANVPVCPAVIGLATILPTIIGRMTIDGSTQPTSTANTDPTAFNANLCVVIKPASGTLSAGFTVPANSFASLSLRGLAIGGFSQPVRILGGQGSLIAGNQFGGSVGAVALPGAGLNAITIGSNASGDISVGGVALADRNVIGGAGTSGVDNQSNASAVFTTCQIVNNLIGLARDGHTQLANAFGINNTGSGCQIVGNRVAGNSITNIWVQGANNIVQQNVVGEGNQGQGYFTNTTGILVTGSNNLIGAGGNGGSFTANTVRFNIAGGVVVKGDLAGGNSVNANRIYDNGASANGMDIDLLPSGDVAGPTANDNSDLDAGPNQLQNFPVAGSLVYTAPGSVDRPANLIGQLVTQPGTYRIDIYFSNAINVPGRRGHAEIPLTHATVQVPASGRVSFSVPILVPNQNAGGVISLTATNSGGNTSEVGIALATDAIFADGIE